MSTAIEKLMRNLYIKLRFMNFIFRDIPNKKIWEKAFKRFYMDLRQEPYQHKKWLLQGFTSRKLRLIKRNQQRIEEYNNKYSPVLISVVKDELDKLPLFFQHYRKLGIKNFVIIDNMSSDKTINFLMKQKDTDIYLISEKFRGYTKEGWINQILAQYGFNRWYLVVDADELLVWPQLETKSLEEMIYMFQKKKIYRPLAIMVDMYSEKRPYQRTSRNIFQEFCYFDKDTYYWRDDYAVNILSGGPRERRLKSKVYLNKTPLFYFRPHELFCCAHYMYPYQKHIRPECMLVLLHYKFAYKGNYDKMRDYVENGIDKNRIEESKACIHKKALSFFYEGSECLDQIEKLREIECVKDLVEINRKN